jgi:tetraacyldisaccharide 4'-kinase
MSKARWARSVWARQGILSFLQWLVAVPLSLLYGLGARARNACYRLGLLRTKRLPRPVVSVGNLTVGGTGKTPTTIWLARELAKRGYKVAILSRGYKGDLKQTVVLDPASEAAPAGDRSELLAGDEAVMMARIFGQKVGVAKKRYQAGSEILRGGDVDVFVLDDGFQHRELSRDLDLLLLGEDSNGWLLPAGAFREPRAALRRADCFLVTGARERWGKLLRRMPPEAVFYGALEPRALLGYEAGRWRELPLTLLDRNKVLAVSAIADPTPFYRMIYDWEGEIVDTIEFPDHHSYSARDWQRITRASHSVDMVVTTEKDIVKLTRFPFAREKLLAMRVEMVVENGEALIQRIEKKIKDARQVQS